MKPSKEANEYYARIAEEEGFDEGSISQAQRTQEESIKSEVVSEVAAEEGVPKENIEQLNQFFTGGFEEIGPQDMHTINKKAPERPSMPNIEQASTSQELYPNCKLSASSYHRCVTGLDSRML